MRISKLADYGTVVMVYLAKNPDVLSTARDIAEHTRLSLPTVSKLLKQLTATGLLMSVRGAMGGYRLAKEMTAISIADIVYAFEANRGLTECATHEVSCSLQTVCHIKGNWQLISDAIEKALSSVSLAALANPSLSASDVTISPTQISNRSML